MKRQTKKPAKVRPPRKREKVLVVMHPGGLVEVYASADVDVHICNRLFVDGDTGDLATAVDEYLEATLPKQYRGLHWPNRLRAVGMLEKITPESAMDTLYQLYILRGLRADREAKRPAPAAITRARRVGR
ncbi:MAG: hypothetical protein K8R46_10920 [Pirellulales bacterium]|nr:hypothetical protein [Pirellulales bacterium]